jgi:uncharacterized membrane protein
MIVKMMAKKFFTEKEQQQIVEAIKTAELNTSGEIRVHLETKCPGDVLDRATYWFAELKMHKTELRNGVLFYMASGDKKFAILGDAGINAKVGADYWDKIKEQMSADFSEGNFAKGIITGILSCGEQLSNFFPYQSNDNNELSDDISFGK